MSEQHGPGPTTDGLGLQPTVGEHSSDGVDVPMAPELGASDDPFIGRVFKDAYRVEALIGQGGMGAVYRGIQLAVGREVAIKVLRPATFMQQAAKEALIARFKREAVATSVLNHPNTVRLFDFGEGEDGTLFLVLELLRGRSLSQVIRDEGALQPSRVASVAYQICRSLAEAHNAGIIHRDLKPDNVFLCEFEDQSDFVKVMDFGIARVVDSTEGAGQVTQTGATVGTPAYMAPEQAMAAEIKPATDLYSVGIMIYEMLQGRVPFSGDTFMSVALRHLNEAPPPLVMQGAPPDISNLWQALLDRLLAKVPEERPQSAREVADTLQELERVSAEAGIKTVPDAMGLPEYVRDAGRGKPSTPPTGDHQAEITMAEQEGIRPPERKRRGLVWGLAAASVAAAAIAAVVLSGGNSNPPPKGEVVAADQATNNGPAMKADKPESASDPAKPEPKVPVKDDAPTTSRLTMTSVPTGAKVFRGGSVAAICTTPCDVTVPKGTGPETLLVKLEGHTVKEVTVNLQPGATVRQAVALIEKAEKAAPTPVTPPPAPVTEIKPADDKAEATTDDTKTAAKTASKRKKTRKKKASSKKTATKKTGKKKAATAAATPPPAKKKKKKFLLPKFSGADPTRKK